MLQWTSVQLCTALHPTRRRSMARMVMGILAVLFVRGALHGVASAQALYRMTQIDPPSAQNSDGNTYGYDMNGSGQITGGWTNAATGYGRCFFWGNNGAPAKDLGTLGGSYCNPNGINASGQIAGDADLASGVSRAFLWRNDGTAIVGLGSIATIRFSDLGYALNDAGEVTGIAAVPLRKSHAFLWKNDGTPMLDLGTLPSGEHPSAAGNAINGGGQVTGVSTGPGYYRVGPNHYVQEVHAFLWTSTATGLQDLGTLGGSYSDGLAINDAGDIAGNSRTKLDAATHAFWWDKNTKVMHDLGTLGGPDSSFGAMNALGQVTGSSAISAAGAEHAFLWRNDGTRMVDLGGIGGDSNGSDLNSAGQVVGTAYFSDNATPRAFVWRNDGTRMQDLNALIDPQDPLRPYVTLLYAERINDAGQILANGNDNRTGLSHAYFLQGTILTLSPRSIAFANQAVNTSSAAKAVTVKNTSSKVTVITSIALLGTGSNQFSSSNNCGSSVVGNGSCTIKVTFKPTSKGAKAATLSVNGGGGGLRIVSLTGTGN